MKSLAVPSQLLMKRLKNFNEVETGFSKRVAIEEARKFPQSHLPSCQPKCPLGINILEFVRLLREGNISESYKKIREQNCLPGICGRICRAPCEESFMIGEKKVPIAVRALERFVADHGRPKLFGREKLSCAKKKVAVIGSGPAGLTAASVLAKELYCVTVFESLPLPGGVLRYGIPGFRLPVEVLDVEIDQIRDLGIEFQSNVTVGRTMGFDDLFKRGFSAVLLAGGKSRPELLDLPGTDACGVFFAQELLMRQNFSPAAFQKEADAKLGRKVLVIGNRSKALDCARVLRRFGKEVEILFPGMEEDIDVHPNELKSAREENIGLQAMTKAVRIEVDSSGRVTGVLCKHMDFAERKGEWMLVPVPDGEEVLPAESVVIAGGSEVNFLIKKVLPDLKFNKDGTIWIDEQTGQTSISGVFAAGDMVDAREQVLAAMVSGKWAAQKMMEFLKE